MASSVSTTEYTDFDILGRVKSHKQTTDGTAYTTGYVYNLSGALVEQTYPSGRVVKNVLDNDGDLSMVQSKKNATAGYWNYAKNFTYNAAGAVSSMQLGNGRWESTEFNSRLQPTQIALGATPNATNLLKLDYEYGASDSVNNGNITKQTITVPTVGSNNGFVATQTYSYDSLNRLKQATENITPNGGSATQSWKQTFTFDRYGNRRFDLANGNTTFPDPNCPEAICNPTISTSNNRLTSNGWSYDSAGNTTNDAERRQFTYDAENKQTEVRDSENTVIGQYRYDGDGKRVKKIVPATGEATIFVYDASGKSIAEYSTVVESAENAKVAYLTADHLGSPRINTDRDGNVTARHDYMPYGEEIATSQRTTGVGYTTDSVRKQFTSYERDIESSLDFAEARYYNFNHGRFTSSDPLLSSGRVEDPQTWNRYAYVLNNPLYYIDPDGLYECTGTKDQCTALRDSLTGAKNRLVDIAKQYGKNSDEYKKTERALNSYGCESKGGNCVDANGKTVLDANGKAVKDTSGISVDFKLNGAGATTSLNGKTINISFTKSFSGSEPLYQGLVGNEGSNAADAQDFLATGKSVSKYQSEYDSALVQAVIGEFVARDDKKWNNFAFTINPTKGQSRNIDVWNKSWVTPDLKTLRANRQNNLNTFLKEDKQYLLTPTNRAGRSPIFYRRK